MVTGSEKAEREMDESSILRRRGLQVGEPSVLEHAALSVASHGGFQSSSVIPLLGMAMCSVLTIYLAPRSAGALVTGLTLGGVQ